MAQNGPFVCNNCFRDPGLVGFIQENAVSNECSFCQTKCCGPIAASMDEVSAYFMNCIRQEYDPAVNVPPGVGSEGGWIGTYWRAYDLALEELGLEFPQDNHDQLLPHLFGLDYEQRWCEANSFGLNDSEMDTFSWDDFCQVVMHERRYFFLTHEGNPHELEADNPGEVLHRIFEYAHQMSLFTQMPSGSHLFRARWEKCGKPSLETPDDLGPPPEDKALQSNRMSPAGIPMFYGCDDQDTALKETASGPGFFAIGRFENLRTVTLLDLTNIAPIPSIFAGISEAVEESPRTVLKFLHHIAHQVSRPIKRGERAEIDYVPTQVVTEFIRDQLTWTNARIDGIKYASSVHPDHNSYVLFATQANVDSMSASEYPKDVWLKLTETQYRTFNPEFDCAP